MTTNSSLGTGFKRCLSVIRALAAPHAGGGRRLTEIAEAVALPPPTVHRILRTLMIENIVEQDQRSKAYRLGIHFFELAARSGDHQNLRSLCRPTLTKLSATLGDSVFLLVRVGYDVVCLDRAEGMFAIKTFTGAIGGRVALGVGQGSLAILAHLPESEQEEVIRFNALRLRECGVDETYVRSELKRIHMRGYAGTRASPLPGVGAVARPIFDCDHRAVAALSIGTVPERLDQDRMEALAEILAKETEMIGRQVHPFEPVAVSAVA